MPPAARVGDATHCREWSVALEQCISLVNAIAIGSPNVIINSSPAAKVGSVTTHPCTVISGSATVYINGVPASRMGDFLSCFCGFRGYITSGSSNVIIG